VVGPLTQRLVTALVEDRISQYTVQATNGGTREELNGGNGEFHLIPRPGLVKALGLDAAGPGAPVPLESRLKIVCDRCWIFCNIILPIRSEELTICLYLALGVGGPRILARR